jgi:hypothetical protein
MKILKKVFKEYGITTVVIILGVFLLNGIPPLPQQWQPPARVFFALVLLFVMFYERHKTIQDGIENALKQEKVARLYRFMHQHRERCLFVLDDNPEHLVQIERWQASLYDEFNENDITWFIENKYLDNSQCFKRV